MNEIAPRFVPTGEGVGFVSATGASLAVVKKVAEEQGFFGLERYDLAEGFGRRTG
ncbi:hypothetical protein [Puniceicoccus vermicola]|uniref:Uncharacterized protein n=1 Tax=Puniceicoccus vermicola TaxID=388746 RepID=A0A7X1E5K1_9BACT|nr:hypothetical protein [Puniceicoccus vermicola]MBC2603740.1 hypothetical protein [Puniceicoccus vermicola]